MASIASQPNFQTVRLAAGRHEPSGTGVCVMELASMLAGERFSDHPRSVCPVLAGIFRAYNDWLDDKRRKDLYGYASRAAGTRGDHALELDRAEIAIAWGRQEYLRRSRGVLALRRMCRQPRLGDAPDEIGSYVVSSLGRRIQDDAHARLLSLLDRLVELSGSPDWEAVPALAPALAEAPGPELTHEYLLASTTTSEPATEPEQEQAPEPLPVIRRPPQANRRRAESAHPFAHLAASAAF